MKSILPWMVELLSTNGGASLLDQGPLGCEGSAESLVELRTLSQKVASQWKRSGGRITMKFHVLAEHLADQMAFHDMVTQLC